MEFNTHSFLIIFLPSVLGLYSFTPLQFRVPLLAISSLIFYSFSGLVPVVLLVFAAATAYIFIKYVSSQTFSLGRNKFLLFLTCLFIALPFLAIKYIFPSAGWLGALIESDSLNYISNFTSGILLPAGISFYTFQLLSSVFDSNKNSPSDISFIELLGYTSFFPQLIAGPIVRLSELLPQLRALSTSRRTHSEYVNDVICGLKLIALGLLAKTIISDVLSTFYLYVAIEKVKFLDSIFIILSKSAIIYADFWGYSSMAIGLALLFGIKLPRNFLQPYSSRNIQEFWRRWHVTLSRWFADYIYKPIGGRNNYVYSLTIVFMLTGVWHGYGLQFLLWGFLHGLSVIIFIRFVKGKFKFAVMNMLAPLITFGWVSTLWILFFYSFDDSLTIYKSLLSFDLTQSQANIASTKRWIYLFICLAVIFFIDDDIFFKSSRHNYEKTPVSVDTMLDADSWKGKNSYFNEVMNKENKETSGNGDLQEYLLWQATVNALIRIRRPFTTIVDEALKSPFLLPFVIMFTMLFFSYRSTFVYFRF
jgi:alginate O-acetyltransferase complex protein AlgI